ncbi:MAG: PQQ-dependent sugar dehydrogenase [Nitrospira sp.]|nr:PQQ-dependent sugar dehydrogenase [Nitrospira sp.]
MRRIKNLSLLSGILLVGLLSVSEVQAVTVSDPFDPFNPIVDTITPGAFRVNLRPIVSSGEGLTAPHLLVGAHDGTNRLFVADQIGQVRLIQGGVLQSTPFLDARSHMVTLNPRYDERGLLGLAFSPTFGVPGTPGYGKLYTLTSEPVTRAADFTVPMPPGASFSHQNVLAEWTVSATNPNVVDPALRRELLRVDWPRGYHNGGMLAFGPDHYLYISMGDGGASRNGQDLTNPLGDVLRIDPHGTNSANGQYGIPSDNPFVGTPGAVQEIYGYGLRNPWRFSFDSETGTLVLGDVGQGTVEEINIITAGGNYGWNLKEGQFRYNPATGQVSNDLTGLPANLIDPVLQYDHDEGTTVIGGFVYRGSAIPELEGKYIFGDWGAFAAPRARLFVGDLERGTIEELRIANLDLNLWLLGFGQDNQGELYILGSQSLGPSGLTGQIFKIEPVPVPAAAYLFGAGFMGLAWLAGRKCGAKRAGSVL